LFEVLAICGYNLAWRDEEVTGLRVNQVDLINRCIRLYPGETKNDDARVAYRSTDLYTAVMPLVLGKSGEDYMFTRAGGARVVDFRKAWWKVCAAC
jgi:hypothetical protein